MGIEGNATRSSEAVNPAHIVSVQNYSGETVEAIAAHLDVSTDFEHFVYREAELDAIWSMTRFLLAQVRDLEQRDTLMRLHEAAHSAHDLVANGQPREAAAALRRWL